MSQRTKRRLQFALSTVPELAADIRGHAPVGTFYRWDVRYIPKISA